VISGLTKLAITKLDVLNGLSQVYICTQYTFEGKRIDYFPANIEDVAVCRPVIENLKAGNRSTRSNIILRVTKRGTGVFEIH